MRKADSFEKTLMLGKIEMPACEGDRILLEMRKQTELGS